MKNFCSSLTYLEEFKLVIFPRKGVVLGAKFYLDGCICKAICACSVTQLGPTPWPQGCSPPGSSDRGTSQAGTLEWAAISYSGGSFRPRAVRLSTRLVTKHLFLSSCEWPLCPWKPPGPVPFSGWYKQLILAFYLRISHILWAPICAELSFIFSC